MVQLSLPVAEQVEVCMDCLTAAGHLQMPGNKDKVVARLLQRRFKTYPS